MNAAAHVTQGERVADVLIAIEAVDLATIHAAPLVVISRDAPPHALVGLHVGASHFRLSLDDARLTAEILQAETDLPGACDLAQGLFATVGMADLLLLGQRARRLAQACARWCAEP
jgi:hypothetical protein